MEKRPKLVGPIQVYHHQTSQYFNTTICRIVTKRLAKAREVCIRVAARAERILSCLPTSGTRFDSLAQHIRFSIYVVSLCSVPYLKREFCSLGQRMLCNKQCNSKPQVLDYTPSDRRRY